MAKRGENIYKRKDGRYEGRYIKGRNIEGKLLFGYVYGYTYAETKSALILLKAATCTDATIRIIGKGSLSEFMSYWLENIENGVKDSTYAQYHERVYTHIVPELGHLSVSKLTREQVQNFVDKLSKKGLSSSTVRNIAGLLSSAMKKAAELCLTSCNPCIELSLPHMETKERRALNRAEQVRLERLLPHADGGTECGILLALYTGLRIGEICALRWRDVELISGTLTVCGTLQRVRKFNENGSKTVLMEGMPKSKRSLRKIPLPADLANRLRRLRKDMPEDFYILTGCKTPIEPRTFRERFNKLAAQAGLDVPFHTLRHTFATRCLEYNFDIQTVSELLGHSTAGITMKVYAHSVFEHKRLLTSRLHILSDYNEPSDEPSAAVSAY